MKQKEIDDHKASVTKLRDLVNDIQICMLATTNEEGVLSSRPMYTIETDGEGNLWFFTNEFSEKIHEQDVDHKVHLIYAHPGKNTYLHIRGTSKVIKDRKRIKELWNPAIKAWYPEGVDDPKLCLLKVAADEAKYWNASSNKMIVLFNMVKAIVNKDAYDDSEVGTLNFEQGSRSIH